MNLTYQITEINNEKYINIDELVKEFTDNVNCKSNTDNNSHMAAMQLDYTTNYTVKMLGNIMDYYNLSKRKLCKEEIIQIIILFEMEEDNSESVEKRRRLWKNIQELNKDAYFSKFILFES